MFARNIYCILFICLILMGMLGCSPRTLRDTRQTLSVADSLRVHGVLYDDSITISNTVTALSRYKYLYPSDYANANYYYGRLLRDRGNQPAAMQCFIDALHTDPGTPFNKRIGRKYRHVQAEHYHLLGRVYTNIAVMCRLEGNHQLAYEMFAYSSKKFSQAKDTIAYYYALNSMAFELAELSQKDECLALIKTIQRNCNNATVSTKILETISEAYFMVQQYDSAIYYANLLQQYGNHEPTGFLIKAQSYAYLNKKDSAVYYASIVSENSSSLFDLNNSLYILANHDQNAILNEIQEIHSNRADIQKQIEIRRSELAHAIELLQQDMNKKPNYMGFCLFAIAIFIIVATSFYAYMQIKAKQAQAQKNIEIELQKQMQLQIEQAKLKAENKQILSKNNDLLLLQSQIIQQHSEYKQRQIDEIEKLCAALKQSHNIKAELHWSDYNNMCETINLHFNFLVNKLKLYALSGTEIKLCVLVLLNLRFNQIAEILPYAQNSVGKLKDTTAKRLGTTGKQLRKYLLDLVIDTY